MANNRYNNNINGLHTLAYMGTNASQPPQFLTYNRAPTTNDNSNVAIGDEWLDQSVTPPDVYKLVSLAGGIATWILIAGNAGTVTELTGNDGLMATPLLGNINIKGDGTNITVTRSPDIHSLLITPGTNGTPASSFPTGAGASTTSGTTAVPTAAGVLNVLGSHNVLTGGVVANTITVFGTNAITLGDLSVIAANSGAVTCTTGDVIITAGDLTLPNTNTAGNQGIIKFGGNRWISNFGTSNTFVGQSSGNTTLTGTSNNAFGASALTSLTTGSSNIAIGANTGSGYTSSESSNIVIGTSAGATTESGVIRINTAAAGDNNIFIGQTSGNTTLTVGVAAANVALGKSTMLALTTGVGNNAMGVNTLAACTTGTSNTAMGNACMTALTQGNSNTAIGRFAGVKITTGSQNEAIGANALDNLTTGSNNTVFGLAAGTGYTGAESSNIVIRNAGTVGESNVIRIGSTGGGAGQQNKCWIAGIRGVTTDINDAVAVLIDSAGQLGTTSSSARYKKNIEDLGSMSEDIYNLRPVSFDYKNSSSPFKSVGLIAEEVEEVIPWLVVYDKTTHEPETVKYQDLVPLLLNEIIKLNKRISELEK